MKATKPLLLLIPLAALLTMSCHRQSESPVNSHVIRCAVIGG